MSAPIVSVDHDAIKADLSELVRKTVEDTLNALLAEEADDLICAERYERDRRGVPGRGLPKIHRALLPQRALQGA